MALADETARRVRAARSNAGMTAPELAGALNMSKETLSRIENGRRAASTDELRVVSQMTGVPLAFLTHGFEAEEPQLSDRVAQLESVVTELRAGLVALSADSLRRTREPQGLAGTDRPPARREANG